MAEMLTQLHLCGTRLVPSERVECNADVFVTQEQCHFIQWVKKAFDQEVSFPTRVLCLLHGCCFLLALIVSLECLFFGLYDFMDCSVKQIKIAEQVPSSHR